MFENVLETSNARPVIIDSESDGSAEEPTPIKKPAPPAKRKLGPKPAASKRKIVSSDSEASPAKAKVIRYKFKLVFNYKKKSFPGCTKEKEEDCF